MRGGSCGATAGGWGRVMQFQEQAWQRSSRSAPSHPPKPLTVSLHVIVRIGEVSSNKEAVEASDGRAGHVGTRGGRVSTPAQVGPALNPPLLAQEADASSSQESSTRPADLSSGFFSWPSSNLATVAVLLAVCPTSPMTPIRKGNWAFGVVKLSSSLNPWSGSPAQAAG